MKQESEIEPACALLSKVAQEEGAESRNCLLCMDRTLPSGAARAEKLLL